MAITDLEGLQNGLNTRSLALDAQIEAVVSDLKAAQHAIALGRKREGAIQQRLRMLVNQKQNITSVLAFINGDPFPDDIPVEPDQPE